MIIAQDDDSRKNLYTIFMNFGFHHHRKLRKAQVVFEDKLKFVFDKIAYIAGVGMAVMTAPQIWKIFTTQNASGVSVFTWSMYTVGSAFWLCYGVVHRDKPIIVTNAVATSLQLVIVIGAILYS
jgi:MtN3 and saliva related transmembrane protein